MKYNLTYKHLLLAGGSFILAGFKDNVSDGASMVSNGASLIWDEAVKHLPFATTEETAAKPDAFLEARRLMASTNEEDIAKVKLFNQVEEKAEQKAKRRKGKAFSPETEYVKKSDPKNLFLMDVKKPVLGQIDSLKTVIKTEKAAKHKTEAAQAQKALDSLYQRIDVAENVKAGETYRMLKAFKSSQTAATQDSLNLMKTQAAAHQMPQPSAFPSKKNNALDVSQYPNLNMTQMHSKAGTFQPGVVVFQPHSNSLTYNYAQHLMWQTWMPRFVKTSADSVAYVHMTTNKGLAESGLNPTIPSRLSSAKFMFQATKGTRHDLQKQSGVDFPTDAEAKTEQGIKKLIFFNSLFDENAGRYLSASEARRKREGKPTLVGQQCFVKKGNKRVPVTLNFFSILSTMQAGDRILDFHYKVLDESLQKHPGKPVVFDKKYKAGPWAIPQDFNGFFLHAPQDIKHLESHKQMAAAYTGRHAIGAASYMKVPGKDNIGQGIQLFVADNPPQRSSRKRSKQYQQNRHHVTHNSRSSTLNTFTSAASDKTTTASLRDDRSLAAYYARRLMR